MSFSKDIPNYKHLYSKHFLMNEAPSTIWEGLEAYANRASSETPLQEIVNNLNDCALIPPTQNWGDNWLQNDLKEAFFSIRKKVNNGDFPLLMDVISRIARLGSFGVKELNEFLEMHKLGYQLYYDSFNSEYLWEERENIENISEKIDATKIIIKTQSQQALEHLEQAKKQLSNSSNERARKDAVRDCLSALETIVKQFGENNDIREATKILRKNNKWGNESIVKDGDALFNLMHRLYPDLRHGSTESSNMSLNEARYWTERITTYIDYMVRQKENI